MPNESASAIFIEPKSDKRLHRAWSMYDWANSAYNLVITSTIFPAYYEAITTQRKEQTGEIISDTVSFFGIQVKNSSLFDYSIAAAYLVIALLFAHPFFHCRL